VVTSEMSVSMGMMTPRGVVSGASAATGNAPTPAASRHTQAIRRVNRSKGLILLFPSLRAQDATHARTVDCKARPLPGQDGGATRRSPVGRRGDLAVAQQMPTRRNVPEETKGRSTGPAMLVHLGDPDRLDIRDVSGHLSDVA